MSQRARAAWLLTAGLLPLGGCASLQADGLWVLPPLAPPHLEERLPATGVAALGSSTLLAGASRWAPEDGALELGHVLRSVEESYPLLGAARQEQVLAQAQQLSALGAFDLGLKGGGAWGARGYYENNTATVGLEQRTGLWGLEVWGGYRLGAGDFDPTYDGRRQTNHGGELRVGASLPLLRDGSIDAARRDLLGATLDREVAGAELALRRLRFEREAALAYWRWLAAGRRLAVAKALLALAEERQEGISLRHRRGDAPEIELVDNQRLVVRRGAMLVSARRDLEQAAIALSLFLRDAAGQPLRVSESALPGGFPEPARPEPALLLQDLQAALRQRPELLQMAQRRGRAEVELRYARNQMLPQLDVSVSVSQDLDRSRPSPTKGELELQAGLEFGFPIQNRRARGRALANEARIQQLSELERDARDRIEAEVRDAFSALVAAIERLGRAREAAELAQRVARAERRRFQLGDSNVLVLNLREEAGAEAELAVVGALLDAWSAAVVYRAAVGASAMGS